MLLVKNILHKLKKMNLRSVILNFRLLPFNQAIHFPLLIERNVRITKLYKGGIRLYGDCKIPGIVQLGYNSIGISNVKRDSSILQVEKGGCLKFYGRCFIANGFNISINENAEIVFGNGCVFTGRDTLISQKNIEFGCHCTVSWDSQFMDTDLHKIIQNGRIINEPKGIKIGNHVWIGCRVNILKGTEILDNCIIGASSLVSGKLLESNAIYAGNPAKIIKQNIEWQI